MHPQRALAISSQLARPSLLRANLHAAERAVVPAPRRSALGRFSRPVSAEGAISRAGAHPPSGQPVLDPHQQHVDQDHELSGVRAARLVTRHHFSCTSWLAEKHQGS